ncbi:MAG: N-acetylmuramoyl-L-alanine amidase [Acidobacteria bacterium]|nr:N-acetylmuramoyl-L-alanine amidase [Acidobacteriota bacterium]
MRNYVAVTCSVLLAAALLALVIDPENGIFNEYSDHVDRELDEPLRVLAMVSAPTTAAPTTTIAAPTTVAPTTSVTPTTWPPPPTTWPPLPTTTSPPATIAPVTSAVPTTKAALKPKAKKKPKPEAQTEPTVAPTPPADKNLDGGVVISPTGIALPVIEKLAEGWKVETPCGLAYTIVDGTHIGSADFVIDAGHGGSESGSVGPNGLVEKELNLDVANRVASGLEALGYTVVRTRTSDVRLPLKARAHIANALSPHAFLSVHHNGGATQRSSVPGTEVFYDYGAPESKRLSGLIYEEMIASLSAFPTSWVRSVRAGVQARLNQDGSDLYGIHRYTPDVPSVITEALWISNSGEADILARQDVRQAEADAMVRAVTRWRTTSDAGSGFNEDFVDGTATGTGGYGECADPLL